MGTAPDFRRAQFILSPANPYQLTAPRASTLFFAEEKEAETEDRINQPYPDPTFNDVFDSLQNALNQKKSQYFAFCELVNSELVLVKKSFFVTVFAALSAFAVGTVCWLIFNIALAAIFHELGIHFIASSLILLLLNAVTAWGLFRLAKNAYGYLSFSRVIKLLERVVGTK